MLLVRRGTEPHEGDWALPGGFVEYDEHVEEACLRELEEETGLEGEIDRLVNVYSDPDRDPRGHVVTVVYRVLPRGGDPEAADDADQVRFFPLANLPDLAFDHGIILLDFMDEYGVDAGTFAKD